MVVVVVVVVVVKSSVHGLTHPTTMTDESPCSSRNWQSALEGEHWAWFHVKTDTFSS